MSRATLNLDVLMTWTILSVIGVGQWPCVKLFLRIRYPFCFFSMKCRSMFHQPEWK